MSRHAGPPFVALALLSLQPLVNACVTSPPSKPVIAFPAAREIQAMAQRAVPPMKPPQEAPLGLGWQLEGPFPVAFSPAPWQARDAASASLARGFAQVHAKSSFTEAMHCVARETGRFVLAEGQYPQQAFRTFVLGACGATPVYVSVGGLTGQIDPRMSSEAYAEKFAQQYRETVARYLQAATDQGLEVGVWIGRQGNKVALQWVAGAPQMQISRLTRLDGEVPALQVEGRLFDNAQYIEAYANQGRFASVACTADIATALPEFRVTCPIDPEDETSWFELMRFRPKHVLGQTVARALLRKGDGPLAFKLDDYGLQPDDGLPKDADLRMRLLSQLNLVRQQAALIELDAAAGEMRTAQALAPHLFALQGKTDNASVEQENKTALGLLAGWTTGGLIRDGYLVHAQVPMTRSPTLWLRTMLQTPAGRVAMLDGMAEKASVGLVTTTAPESLQAVFTGWSFHRDDNHAADVIRIYRRIIKARQRLGLPMVKRLAAVSEAMKQQLALVNGGEANPGEALENTLQLAVDRYGAGMRGWVLEAHSLEAVAIPEDVIARPELALEVGVTHHRPPGAAWAQYVVLIAFLDEGMTARATRGYDASPPQTTRGGHVE